MRTLSTLLVAASLTLSGCAWTPSGAPTLPTTPPPPMACMSDCTTPPKPTSTTAAGWIEQLLDWAYECRSRHSDCAGWVRLHHGAQ